MDRCRHVLRLRLARDHSILNPQKWHCAVCNTTESVWACLSCAHVACGRYIEEHALRHYEEQRHPLALEVNELYVFCYACDDYVLNDNATGDLKLLRQTLSAIKTQKYDEDGDLAATTRSGRSRRSSAMSSLVVADDAVGGGGGLGGALRAQELQLRDEDRMFTALWHRRRALLGRAFRVWLFQTSGGQRLLEEERRLEEEEERRREALEKRRALKRQMREELEKAPPRKSSRLQKRSRRGRPPKSAVATAAAPTPTAEKSPAKKRKKSESPVRASSTTTLQSTSSAKPKQRARGRPKSTPTAPTEKPTGRRRTKGLKTPTATPSTSSPSSSRKVGRPAKLKPQPQPKPKPKQAKAQSKKRASASPAPKPGRKRKQSQTPPPSKTPRTPKKTSTKTSSTKPTKTGKLSSTKASKLTSTKASKLTSTKPIKTGKPSSTKASKLSSTKASRPGKLSSTKTSKPSSTKASKLSSTKTSKPSKLSSTKSSKPTSTKRRNSGDSPSPIKRRPTVTPGVTGLRNLGNTCYMNSILQVLSHLHLFRECFLRLDLSQALELLASAVGGKLVAKAHLGAGAAGRPPSASAAGSPGGAKGGSGRGRGRGRGSLGSGRGGASGPGRGGGVGGSGGGLGQGLSGGGAASAGGRSMELIQHKEPSSAHLSLCHELHTLFQVMWSGKWALVSPFAMLHSVWQLIPAFRGYAQQDAQEFLCELLDKVQRELESSTRGGGGGGVVAVDGHSRGMMHGTAGGLVGGAGSVPQKRLVKQVLSVVNTIFHGQLLSQVTCLACEQRSDTVEPFWDLSLEFPQRYHSNSKEPQEGQCLLTEMLAKFTETEALEGSIYACQQCNLRVPSPERHRRSSKSVVLTEAKKQLMIHKLPHVLRLHLKRFRWSGRNHREKIGVHVAFEQTLNMEPYCCKGSAPNPAPSGSHFLYELSAVVMHHGKGFGSGHYTAYCYNTEGGFWVHCNDSKMSICSVEEVCKAQAYILFYTQLLSQDKVKSAA